MHKAAQREGAGEVRVEIDRLSRQLQGDAQAVGRKVPEGRQSAHVKVVGIEARRRLSQAAVDFGLAQVRFDRAGDLPRHLVMQVENILERAVELVRPEVRARSGIDELRRDAHPVCRLAHRPLEHVAHAEVAPDLLHVHGLALVGEARVAGDHEQPAQPAEGGGDLLDHAVGEVFLLRVAAHVGERQHGNRRAIGQGKPRLAVRWAVTKAETRSKGLGGKFPVGPGKARPVTANRFGEQREVMVGRRLHTGRPAADDGLVDADGLSEPPAAEIAGLQDEAELVREVRDRGHAAPPLPDVRAGSPPAGCPATPRTPTQLLAWRPRTHLAPGSRKSRWRIA